MVTARPVSFGGSNPQRREGRLREVGFFPRDFLFSRVSNPDRIIPETVITNQNINNNNNVWDKFLNNEHAFITDLVSHLSARGLRGRKNNCHNEYWFGEESLVRQAKSILSYFAEAKYSLPVLADLTIGQAAQLLSEIKAEAGKGEYFLSLKEGSKREVSPAAYETIAYLIEQAGVWRGDLEENYPIREEVTMVRLTLHEIRLGEKDAEIAELRELSCIDPLSNVYNRRELMKRLEAAVEKAKRTGSKFSVLFFDIDHFKTINDSLGHSTGDEVIKKVGHLLNGGGKLRLYDIRGRYVRGRNVRERYVRGRYGGEEFVIGLEDTDENQAMRVAERLLRTIREEVKLSEREVTVSIGIAQWQSGETAEQLLGRADNAMYVAKGLGRDNYVIDSTPV